MVVSTMIRAKQTADEIEKQLPAPIERVSTDLLREGAPFPPEPHLGHWKPDVKVWSRGLLTPDNYPFSILAVN